LEAKPPTNADAPVVRVVIDCTILADILPHHEDDRSSNPGWYNNIGDIVPTVTAVAFALIDTGTALAVPVFVLTGRPAPGIPGVNAGRAPPLNSAL